MRNWWKRLLRQAWRHLFDATVQWVVTTAILVLCALLVPGLYRRLEELFGGLPENGPLVVVNIHPMLPAPVVNPPPTPPPPVSPPEQVPLVRGEATRYLRVCNDGQGNEIGRFNVLVFSDEYQWKCNSDREVTFIGDDVDFAGTVLSSPGLQSYLAADEIVAVGSASCDTDDRASQECLALRRARRLQGWIRLARKTPGASPSLQDVQFLTLGQRQPPPGQRCDLNKCGQTGSQRALMLLAVSDREPNVPLSLCLSNILESDPDMGFQSTDFSKFELNPSTPVSDCQGGDS